MFVQFADSTKETVVSVFSCAQDETNYPNQGDIDWDDALFQAYYNAQIPIVQEALTSLKPE